MAKGLILVGLSLVALGVLLSVFPRALAWFGKLPGDIRTDMMFVPVTSMLLVSALLTFIVNVLGWLFSSR